MQSYRKKLIKIRGQKLLFEILYLIVALAAPLIFTYFYVPTISLDPSALDSITFDSHAILHSNISRTSFGLSLIITVTLVVTNGVKYIKDRLASMPFGITKQVFYFIKGLLMPALLISVFFFLNSFLHGFINGLGVTLFVNAGFLFIANCIVKLFLNYYDYYEAKEIHKTELREALDERDAERDAER